MAGIDCMLATHKGKTFREGPQQTAPGSICLFAGSWAHVMGLDAGQLLP